MEYIQSTEQIYLNIFESVNCHEKEYKYLFDDQNILILEYLNINTFDV